MIGHHSFKFFQFFYKDFCYYYLKEMDKNGLDAYMELANTINTISI